MLLQPDGVEAEEKKMNLCALKVWIIIINNFIN